MTPPPTMREHQDVTAIELDGLNEFGELIARGPTGDLSSMHLWLRCGAAAQRERSRSSFMPAHAFNR